MKKKYVIIDIRIKFTVLGFANDNVIIETTAKVDVKEARQDNEKEVEDEDFRSCVRCVTRTIQENDIQTGEATLHTETFCFVIPCV